MPQSLVKILVHIVFSTKNRSDLIAPETENDLYGYIHGIIANNGAKSITANGTANHSHFLVSLGRNDISELIGDIKRDSSSWIKEKRRRVFLLAKGVWSVFNRTIAGSGGNEVYRRSERTP